jgi:hypothetical protein
MAYRRYVKNDSSSEDEGPQHDSPLQQRDVMLQLLSFCMGALHTAAAAGDLEYMKAITASDIGFNTINQRSAQGRTALQEVRYNVLQCFDLQKMCLDLKAGEQQRASAVHPALSGIGRSVFDLSQWQ